VISIEDKQFHVRFRPRSWAVKRPGQGKIITGQFRTFDALYSVVEIEKQGGFNTVRWDSLDWIEPVDGNWDDVKPETIPDALKPYFNP